MIKVNRRTTEKSQKAMESLQQEKMKNGSYNTPEVNKALQELFHGKCYICENKQVTSYQIEHLVPHHNKPDLKYDWNNLFLSCAHCNNTKLDQYHPILDCTVEAAILRRLLRKELSEFKEYVRQYQEAEGEEKEDLKCLLKLRLKDSSPFAAFKRWLIRDHKDAYPELLTYISEI